jgi:FkbM family methyltransferase
MRKMLARLIFASYTPKRIQSLVQHLIGGPRLETVRFGDGHLFECFTGEKYWWMRDAYDEEQRLELEACLTSESVLFDIGAFAGFWEVVLASRCRRVYAFEPSLVSFGRLSRNIAKNQISNVTTIQAAASDQTTKLHLVEKGRKSHISDVGIEVNAVRLDDYVLQHEAPTVVKIDIEGHAGAALRGMRQTLSHCRPILFLQLNNTDEVRACHAVTDDLGYQYSRLGRRTDFPYRCRAVVN